MIDYEEELKKFEPCLDVTEAGDDLALAVLAGMTENMDYAFEAGQELPNRLTLKVRHA